jgi:chromosomal replication initiation ATPase DnaA
LTGGGLLRGIGGWSELKSKGCTLETIADYVAESYGIPTEVLLSKAREGLRVEARSLFCYSAVCDLGVSVTDVARLLGMTASSVSYAVRRGRTMAEKKGFQIGKKELLNN